jgi:hypothetical protein
MTALALASSRTLPGVTIEGARCVRLISLRQLHATVERPLGRFAVIRRMPREQEGTHPAAGAFLGRHLAARTRTPLRYHGWGPTTGWGETGPGAVERAAASAVRYQFSTSPLPSVAACDGAKGAGRRDARRSPRRRWPGMGSALPRVTTRVRAGARERAGHERGFATAPSL